MRILGPAIAALLAGGLIVAVTQLAPAQTPASQAKQILSQAETAAVDGGSQAIPPRTSVSECWEAWKAREHLREGPNPRPSDGLLFLGHGDSEVRANPGTRTWLAARTAAFIQAELRARSALAEAIGVHLKSSRATQSFKSGGDQPPPVPGEQTAPSNIERLNTLTGLALDNAIRQFQPNWNGGGLSDEEKRKQAIALMNRTTEEDEAQARVFAEGAFTSIQCEGPADASSGSPYTVLVGMIQSDKLKLLARAVVDPQFKPPPQPVRPPIADQIAALSSEHQDWMAFSQGARVWSDENGSPVVLGFGVASASSSPSADRAEARLKALAAIQRFVGEKVDAHESAGGGFVDTETVGGHLHSFDTSAFEQRITARAKEVILQGVGEINAWRGTHPYGNVSMQVIALTWSPTSREAAQRLGAAFKASGDGNGRQNGSNGGPSGPVAAPVREGASSDTSGF